jgi:hypothetical protein
MAQRSHRTRRHRNRKHTRKQHGGVKTTTVGKLLKAFDDLDYDTDEIKGILNYFKSFDSSFGKDSPLNTINSNNVITEEEVKRFLNMFIPDSESKEDKEELERINNIIYRKLFLEDIQQKARNTSALRSLAKQPQNGSRATNVFLQPNLSGEIGSYLSGKIGSLASQVNKLKQNMGIQVAPRP